MHSLAVVHSNAAKVKKAIARQKKVEPIRGIRLTPAENTNWMQLLFLK